MTARAHSSRRRTISAAALLDEDGGGGEVDGVIIQAGDADVGGIDDAVCGAELIADFDITLAGGRTAEACWMMMPARQYSSKLGAMSGASAMLLAKGRGRWRCL